MQDEGMSWQNVQSCICHISMHDCTKHISVTNNTHRSTGTYVHGHSQNQTDVLWLSEKKALLRFSPNFDEISWEMTYMKEIPFQTLGPWSISNLIRMGRARGLGQSVGRKIFPETLTQHFWNWVVLPELLLKVWECNMYLFFMKCEKRMSFPIFLEMFFAGFKCWPWIKNNVAVSLGEHFPFS